MSELLKVEDLRKTYKDGETQVEVLKGIDLTMQRGDFASIRGASGAGKSTFLNLLGALDIPDNGSIEVDGENLLKHHKSNTIHLYRRKQIGLIFQNHYLMPDFTVVENVMIPLLMLKQKKKQAHEAAMQMLKNVGIEHRASHYPSQISGGESQRAAVARALVHSPPLVLADEPTGNLDSKNTANLIDLLARLQKEQQLTILVVTHEEDLASVAQQQYEMHDGLLSLH